MSEHDKLLTWANQFHPQSRVRELATALRNVTRERDEARKLYSEDCELLCDTANKNLDAMLNERARAEAAERRLAEYEKAREENRAPRPAGDGMDFWRWREANPDGTHCDAYLAGRASAIFSP